MAYIVEFSYLAIAVKELHFMLNYAFVVLCQSVIQVLSDNGGIA